MYKVIATMLCVFALTVGVGYAADWQAEIQVERTVTGYTGIDNVKIGHADAVETLPKAPAPPQHSVRIVIYQDLTGFAELQKDIKTPSSAGEIQIWFLAIDPRGNQAPPISRTATVRWDASQLDAGGEYRFLKVDFSGNVTDTLVSDMLATTELQVSGTGVDAYAISHTVTSIGEPEIEVVPLALTFGNVAVGGTSTKDVTVSNVGTVDLHVTGIALTDDPAAGVQFSRTDAAGASFTLTPGGSTTLKVQFAPDGVATFTGTLTITSDDTDEASVTITLNGNGVEGGYAADWQAEIQVERTVTGYTGIDNVKIGHADAVETLPKAPAPPQHSVRIVIYQDLTGFAELQKDIKTPSSAGEIQIWFLAIDPRGNQAPPISRTATVRWDASQLDAGGEYRFLKVDFSGNVTDTLVSDMLATTELQVSGTGVDAYAISHTVSETIGLVSVDVEPDSTSIVVGGTQQFTATGKYTSAPDTVLTDRVTWISSDTTVATVDPAGLATGKQVGMTTIRATYQGKEDTAKLVVTSIGEPEIEVVLPQISAHSGQTLSIPIHIDVNGPDPISVSSCVMTITYDSQVVRAYEAAIIGTLVQDWSVEHRIAQGAGIPIDTIHVALATSTDALSSGILFYIRGIASEYASAGESSALTFERCEFDEGAIPVGTENGMVTIVPMLGDVSGNGQVSAYDASLILQKVVGLITLPSVQWPAFTLATADVTGNEVISALDASWVLQYTVGIATRFPAGGGAGAEKIACAEKSIRLGDVDQLSDHRWIVPVEIDEMDAVLAGEMDLSFDGATVVEVRTTERIADYLSAVNIEEDHLRLSFAGAESPRGGGRIIEVVLEGTPVLSIDRVSLNEGGIPVRIVGGEVEIPRAYSLSQNYPNPFNPETAITYDIAKAGIVRLSVYTLTGQHIRTLVDGERTAGTYSVTWDGRDGAGRDVASGVYLCRMEVDDYLAVRKMVLMQ